MSLPMPSEEALAHSARLVAHLGKAIVDAGGWLGFDRFMDLALYAPGLGYYAAGARKFGAAGDFVTAPEMSPLFGQTLAGQVGQALAAIGPEAEILEVGAGSGRLAADVLAELERRGQLPVRYAVLDLSADLRERQRETLEAAVPHLMPRVVWLDQLPERFCGVVLANELLDALPVHAVAWREEGIFERGVGLDDSGRFVWQERPAHGALLAAAQTLATRHSLPPGFESEIGLAASSWIAEWGHRMQRGLLLLIDYGFPQREFYHFQRGRGTLMCHYRHHAHPDPFYLPGLQDITAHVDFTAVAIAGHEAGLSLVGYTTQGQFLMNAGMLDQLAKLPMESTEYIRATAAVNQLLMPHEMGELFKVIALSKGLDPAVPPCLTGFARGDRSARL